MQAEFFNKDREKLIDSLPPFWADPLTMQEHADVIGGPDAVAFAILDKYNIEPIPES